MPISKISMWSNSEYERLAIPTYVPTTLSISKFLREQNHEHLRPTLYYLLYTVPTYLLHSLSWRSNVTTGQIVCTECSVVLSVVCIGCCMLCVAVTHMLAMSLYFPFAISNPDMRPGTSLRVFPSVC